MSATATWAPITRVKEGADCAWCEQPIPAGALAMMSTDAADFFCTACVTKVYEAMKAAQGSALGVTPPAVRSLQ